MDSMVGNAYLYGRNYIATKVGVIKIKDLQTKSFES